MWEHTTKCHVYKVRMRFAWTYFILCTLLSEMAVTLPESIHEDAVVYLEGLVFARIKLPTSEPMNGSFIAGKEEISRADPNSPETISLSLAFSCWCCLIFSWRSPSSSPNLFTAANSNSFSLYIESKLMCTCSADNTGYSRLPICGYNCNTTFTHLRHKYNIPINNITHMRDYYNCVGCEPSCRSLLYIYMASSSL